MYFVTERVAKSLVSIEDSMVAVEGAFRELALGHAEAFPVVMGKDIATGNQFSCKSGAMGLAGAIGVKVGSYWPGNRAKGHNAHASTTILLDPDTGFPKALVEASYLTALRTAASDGVAVKYLSRPESRAVGIVGAGHQAWFELLAIATVRNIRRVRIWSRTTDDADRLSARVQAELGIEDVCAAPLEDVVRASDILVTVTASREPIVEAHWVRPGTHISAMGSDAIGKRELASSLISSACLFADVVDQSVSLGDFEEPFKVNPTIKDRITPIGDVIIGKHTGRARPEDITIYDSSGIALQDLAICTVALRKAIDADLVAQTDFDEPSCTNSRLVEPGV